MSVDNSDMANLLQLQVVTMQQNNTSLNALNVKNATLNATLSQNLDVARQNIGLQAQVFSLSNILIQNIASTRQLGILLVELTRVIATTKSKSINAASDEFHDGITKIMKSSGDRMKDILDMVNIHGQIDPSSTGGASKPQGKQSIWELTKNLGKSTVKKSIGAFSGVIKGMPAAAGAMAASALVMQPFMAMVSGFLEPFSMFTDTFGAFGTILGTAFYPVLIPINTALIGLIPYLVQAADWLGKTGILMGSFGVTMQILNGNLYGLNDTFTNFGADMKKAFTDIFSMDNMNLYDVLEDLWNGFGRALITMIGNVIIDIYEGVKDDIEEALGI